MRRLSTVAALLALACALLVMTAPIASATTIPTGPTSNVAADQVTIWWTTNVSATTEVYYDTVSHPAGTPIEYASSSTYSSVAGTLHSRTLAGLAAGTYYYRVQSADAGGAKVYSAQNSFVVAASTSAPTDNVIFDGAVSGVREDESKAYVVGAFHNAWGSAQRTGGAATFTTSTGAISNGGMRIVGIIKDAASDGAGGWYVVGDFRRAGGLTRNNAAHILPDGGVDPNWNPNLSAIGRDVEYDGAGGVYIGGAFNGANSVNGNTTRNYAAKFNTTTGTVDASWNPNLNNNVFGMTLDGSGNVYLVGDFQGVNSVNGNTTRNRAAKVNTTNGTVNASWDPNLAGGTAYDITLDGAGYAYVVGNFNGVNSVNGNTTRNRAAKVDTTNGTVDATWDPNVAASVLDIELDGAGNAYLGGAFAGANSVNGTTTRNRAAKVNTTNGTVNASWNPDLSRVVNDLELDGTGNVYIVGTFTGANSVNGTTTRNYAAKVDTTNGTADGNWNPNFSHEGNTVHFSGGNLLVGGRFAAAGSSSTRNGAAAITLATQQIDTRWNPNLSATALDIELDRTGSAYIVGNFTGANSVNGTTTRNHAAKVDTVDGTVNASWNPNISNNVYDLELDGAGNAYLVGNFAGANSVNGTTTRNYAAKVDTTNGTVNGSWNPNFSGIVNDLELDGTGSVYVTGAFNGVNSVNGTTTRNRAAKVDTTNGTVDASWNPNLAATGRDLDFDSSGNVYVVGDFNGVNSVNGTTTRNYAAKFNNTNGTVDASWNPNLGGAAYGIEIDRSGLAYIVGLFLSSNGSSAYHLARFTSPNGTLDGAWSPDVQSPNAGSADRPRAAIGCTSGRVYGGPFEAGSGAGSTTQEGLMTFNVSAQCRAPKISGTVVRDEADRKFVECDGTTRNVALLVEGMPKATSTCDAATGAYSFSGVSYGSADRDIVVWIDTTLHLRTGATYTHNTNTTSDIAALKVMQGHVVIRSESATAIAGADINSYDQSDDSDIPIEGGGGTVTANAGVEMHINTGDTFDLQTTGYNLNTPALQIETGATFKMRNFYDYELMGYGTGPCSEGANSQRPLCVDAGGNFVSEPNARFGFLGTGGDIAVQGGVTYGDLTLAGNLTDDYILGNATGQTITFTTLGIGAWWVGGATASMSDYAPNLVGDSISLWFSSVLTSTALSSITLHGSFTGDSGRVSLPSVTLNMDAQTSAPELGRTTTTTNHEWSFYKVNFSNSYTHNAYGTGGTVTTPYNSGGANLDTPASGAVIGLWNDTAVTAGSQPTNGGDWAITGYSGDGATLWYSPTWNGPGNGDDAATSLVSLGPEFLAGGYATWAGQGRNWAVRHYDGSGALPDATTPFGNYDSDGDTFFDTLQIDVAGGNDEVEGVENIGANVFVVGTITDGGADRDWEVRKYDSNGQNEDATIARFDSGTGNDTVAASCYDTSSDMIFVVGSVPTNGGDYAIKALDPGTMTWAEPFGNTDSTDPGAVNDTYVWNSGGAQADVATDCDAALWDATVTGTRTVGANADFATLRVQSDGSLDATWGASGIAITDAGTNGDVANSVMNDIDTGGATGAFIMGSVTTGGGNVAMQHLDGDGQLDISFDGTGWSNGTYTWDSGGGLADAAFGGADTGSGYGKFVVPIKKTSVANGGDIALQKFDYSGDLLSTSGAGNVRAVVRGDDSRPSTLQIGGGLQVGLGTDGGNTYLDLDTNDVPVDTDNSVTISTKGRLRASSTAPLQVANDFSNYGSFYPGTGTVTIKGGGAFRSIIDLGTPAAPTKNSFYNLKSTAPAGTNRAVTQIAFATTNTTYVTNNLSVVGSDCSSQLRIEGDAPTATLDVTGATTNFDYLRVKDLIVTPAKTATNSNDISGNTGWTFSSPCGSYPNPLQAPYGLQSHDTNAQLGSFHNDNITSMTPHFSWNNRAGSNTDKQRVQVYSDPLTADVVGLWHADSSVADASSYANNLTLGTNPANPTYSASKSGFSNALTYDGVDDVATRAYDADFDLDSFTVSAWFKTSLGGAAARPQIIAKSSADTNANFNLYFDRAGGDIVARWSGAGTAHSLSEASTGYLNNSWHHVAFVVDSSTMTSHLYLDGVSVDDQPFTGNVDNPNVALSTGLGLNGSLDELTVNKVALGSDEIQGYFLTGRPHGELLWDSDPTDAGVALASCGSGGRCADIVYGSSGSAASQLLSNGGRYYVTAKLKTVGAVWSKWSEADWFSTQSSLTLSLPGGSALALGGASGALPGSNTTGTVQVDVTTNNAHGYTVSVSNRADGAGMTDGMNAIPRWTGTPTTPSTWPSGTAGYFGFSVISATGGKDTSRWGTGSTATDFTNLKFAGPMQSSSALAHSTSTYAAPTSSIVLGLRLNPALTTPAGTYETNMTITAVANP